MQAAINIETNSTNIGDINRSNIHNYEVLFRLSYKLIRRIALIQVANCNTRHTNLLRLYSLFKTRGHMPTYGILDWS